MLTRLEYIPEYKSPTDYTLTRSTDKTIAYYDNGRIKQITYDNGAWLKYTYDDEHMTYTTLTSSDEITKTVYHYKRTIIGLPTYGGYNPINVFQISDAWGIALNLAEWLYNKVGKSNVVFFRKNDKNIVKKFNDVGKKLKSKGQCTAVAFLRYSSKDENGKWVSHKHIVITGMVDYKKGKKYKYKIYLYGHTNDSDGNCTSLLSLDEFFSIKEFRNKSINLYYLV